MTMGNFTKINETFYQNGEGYTVRRYTGTKRGMYLENEWLLLDKHSEYIDHDWNLATLVRRKNLVLM